MDLINEYALLVAVALPVAVIVALNLLLAWSGEAGTLLLPSLARFPAVAIDLDVPAEAPPVEAREPQAPAVEREELREAA